jgi:MFS family permease
MSLTALGVFLALYDLAEIVLKPVFGGLTDRFGAKPVIVAGLVLFAAASLCGIWAAGPWALGLVRLGQGVAASAFSPASSASVSLLSPPGARGAYFGRYGSWKGLGYAAGPLIGAAALIAHAPAALFAVLGAIAVVTALWVIAALPRTRLMPKQRATLADLARAVTAREFLVPVGVLAASTAALGTLTGNIPALGRAVGLPVIVSAVAVTLLAVTSSLVQPRAGRMHDSGRLGTAPALAGAMSAIILGIAVLVLVPSAASILGGAVLVGGGIGVATPIGFSMLASVAPRERLGRMMGAAELGREAGEAAGPLFVSALVPALALPGALLCLAALPLAAGVGATLRGRTAPPGS